MKFFRCLFKKEIRPHEQWLDAYFKQFLILVAALPILILAFFAGQMKIRKSGTIMSY